MSYNVTDTATHRLGEPDDTTVLHLRIPKTLKDKIDIILRSKGKRLNTFINVALQFYVAQIIKENKHIKTLIDEYTIIQKEEELKRTVRTGIEDHENQQEGK